MPHGDMWEAVAGDTKSSADHYIEHVTSNGKLMPADERRMMWPTGEGQWKEITAAPVGHFLAEGAMGFCTITVDRPEEGGLQLATAYPMPYRGICHTVTVRNVQPDEMGLEAAVQAETEGGILINFFAVDYFIQPRRYKKGSRIIVMLSALVYAIRFGVAEDVVISDPAQIEKFRAAGIDVPAGQPLRFGTKNAAMAVPMEGWNPYEYSFQSPLKDVKRDGDFYCFVLAIARDGDTDIDIEFVAGLHHFPNGTPELGPTVFGRCCIMGSWEPPGRVKDTQKSGAGIWRRLMNFIKGGEVYSALLLSFTFSASI